MLNSQDLSAFLATAIDHAKPRPLGNVKQCETDRRNWWLSAMAELKVNEDRERAIPPTHFHSTADTHVKPVHNDGSHMIWEYGKLPRGFKK